MYIIVATILNIVAPIILIDFTPLISNILELKSVISGNDIHPKFLNQIP